MSVKTHNIAVDLIKYGLLDPGQNRCVYSHLWWSRSADKFPFRNRIDSFRWHTKRIVRWSEIMLGFDPQTAVSCLKNPPHDSVLPFTSWFLRKEAKYSVSLRNSLEEKSDFEDNNVSTCFFSSFCYFIYQTISSALIPFHCTFFSTEFGL